MKQGCSLLWLWIDLWIAFWFNGQLRAFVVGWLCAMALLLPKSAWFQTHLLFRLNGIIAEDWAWRNSVSSWDALSWAFCFCAGGGCWAFIAKQRRFGQSFKAKGYLEENLMWEMAGLSPRGFLSEGLFSPRAHSSFLSPKQMHMNTIHLVKSYSGWSQEYGRNGLPQLLCSF